MTMTKTVNGQAVELTPDEERAILAERAANTPTAADKAKRDIADIERGEPITQRALREAVLALGAANPAVQDSVFYKRAAAQEARIAALRAVL